MKNWWRKVYPSAKSIKESVGLRKFKKYLQHPALWHITRESFARGVGVGMFVAIIPILPFQTAIAVSCCILIRGNIPVAFLISWISNPITILPIVYLTSYVGNLVLADKGSLHTIQAIKLDFGTWHGFWSSLSDWLISLGTSFFVGLPIVAFGAAIFGYLLANFCWYIAIYCRKR